MSLTRPRRRLGSDSCQSFLGTLPPTAYPGPCLMAPITRSLPLGAENRLRFAITLDLFERSVAFGRPRRLHPEVLAKDWLGTPGCDERLGAHAQMPNARPLPHSQPQVGPFVGLFVLACVAPMKLVPNGADMRRAALRVWRASHDPRAARKERRTMGSSLRGSIFIAISRHLAASIDQLSFNRGWSAAAAISSHLTACRRNAFRLLKDCPFIPSSIPLHQDDTRRDCLGSSP
jgi:hypothetical protein